MEAVWLVYPDGEGVSLPGHEVVVYAVLGLPVKVEGRVRALARSNSDSRELCGLVDCHHDRGPGALGAGAPTSAAVLVAEAGPVRAFDIEVNGFVVEG